MGTVPAHGGRELIVLVALLVAVPAVGGAGVPAAAPPSPDGPSTADGTNATNASNATVAVERIDGAALPPGNDTWPAVDAPATVGTNASVAVVVEAIRPDAVNASRLRGLGATVTGRRGPLVEASVPPGRVAAVRSIPWVDRVRAPQRARPLAVSQGVADVGADAIHAAGVTGENVSVGIVDVGFDPDHAEIDANVAATRSFSSGDPTHGTRVAAIVADTAPGADLYLASAGTSVEFMDAVDWLEGRDVDVIITSLGFYSQPYDGDGPVAERADRAVANGTVWVNAAGNAGRDHWEGRFSDPDGDGLHNFAGDDEGNTLNGGDELTEGTRVTVMLQWDEWPTAEHDYDLLLMRERPGKDTIVAESRRVNGESTAAEKLQARVPATDRYSVAIRADDPSATTTVETFFLDRRSEGLDEVEYVNASSSIIAPATGDRVLATGAYDVRDGTLEPYSARGPTDDGDRGIDVIGPATVDTGVASGRFVGTSAAAPHAAGVAALAWAATADPDAGAIATAMLDGADDEGSAGPDIAWGAGRLNATGAVEPNATGGSSLPRVGDSDAPPGDLDGDGRHEDVDGSGTFDVLDVAVLLGAFDDGAVQNHAGAYDFDGSGEVDIVDVAVLLEAL